MKTLIALFAVALTLGFLTPQAEARDRYYYDDCGPTYRSSRVVYYREPVYYRQPVYYSAPRRVYHGHDGYRSNRYYDDGYRSSGSRFSVHFSR